MRTLLLLPVLLTLCPLADAQTPLERGNYLVNTVMACAICHTPRGRDGILLDKNFSGRPQTFVEPTYTVQGSNITPDDATGIGAWSDADIKRALTQGVRPNGSALAPIMTSAYYKVLSPDDLDAIVVYLRSLPAVSNAVQAPYGATLVRNITSHPTAGIGAWSDDEIKRALTHAAARDGRPFKPPMDRAAYSSKLTPEDLAALVAYLRTLPPLEYAPPSKQGVNHARANCQIHQARHPVPENGPHILPSGRVIRQVTSTPIYCHH
jgi:mono/diheme cytochrome c family protein